jgi:hypothetical protein
LSIQYPAPQFLADPGMLGGEMGDWQSESAFAKAVGPKILSYITPCHIFCQRFNPAGRIFVHNTLHGVLYSSRLGFEDITGTTESRLALELRPWTVQSASCHRTCSSSGSAWARSGCCPFGQVHRASREPSRQPDWHRPISSRLTRLPCTLRALRLARFGARIAHHTHFALGVCRTWV